MSTSKVFKLKIFQITSIYSLFHIAFDLSKVIENRFVLAKTGDAGRTPWREMGRQHKKVENH